MAKDLLNKKVLLLAYLPITVSLILQFLQAEKWKADRRIIICWYTAIFYDKSSSKLVIIIFTNKKAKMAKDVIIKKSLLLVHL